MLGRVCALACAIGAAGAAVASPFVYEPFNYTVGNGANGQSGGTGFLAGSSWAYSELGSTGSTSTGTIAAGLTFSDLPVAGGSLLLSVVSSSSSGFSDDVNLKRRPASVPNGTTDEFWTRYLFREGTNRPNVDGFMAGMSMQLASNSNRRFGSWAISASTNDRGGLNVDGSITTSSAASNSLTDSNVYLLIAKFTNINAPLGVARVGTWWALSAADYDAIKSGGITEAELTASCSQYATESVTATAGEPLNLSTSDFYDFRGIRPAVSNAFENYYFDELYSGTTLGDLGLPVPTPGVLWVMAGAAVAGGRRRR